MTMQAQTISVFIDMPWQEVYETIWRPEAFPRWATGLSAAGLHNDNGVWRAKGPGGGDVILRFTAHNPFGVMDHTVCLRTGAEIPVPMRVVANGDGAEVMLTLFRQPGVSVEAFEHDANWVRRDLNQLRDMLTG
ncbi:MAG: polyketide cyclase [Hyphomicrobiales bacterium]|jgi:hypothetical protein|nr:polyketide cyclase [Hyphomicrobiales bacterium]